MPKWEDHKKWNKKYENESKSTYLGESFRRRYPSLKEFKDHCFNYMKTKMNECHSTNEHCLECVRKD